MTEDSGAAQMSDKVEEQRNQSANEWSDDTCRNISNLDRFPKHVQDLDVQKKVIERFLNYYLGGKIPKGLSVTDLVFSVISIMPLHVQTEDTLWDEHEYVGGSLFSLPPEDIELAEINAKTSNNRSEIEHSVSTCDTDKVSGKKKTDKLCLTSDDMGENSQKNKQTEDPKRNELGGEITEIEKRDKNYKSKASENEKFNESPEYSDLGPEEEMSSTSHGQYVNAKQCANKTSVLKIASSAKWSAVKKRPVEEINHPQYSPVQNADFIRKCHKLLEDWMQEKARIILKYFFGVVALTLMRGMTKSYKHIVNTFASTKFLDHVKYINKFSKYTFRYSIPHKEFVGTSYRVFKKREKITRIMFAKIVFYSVYIDDQIPKNPSYPMSGPFNMNILKATVLSHTDNYEMELVSMVQVIVNRLNTESANIAIEITNCDETAESWRKVNKYLDSYLSPDVEARTHHWARVIDEDYFKDLCCANNYPLAVILAVFNEKITANQGIWLSKWIEKGGKECLEKYKTMGHKMFEEFLEKNPFADQFIQETTLPNHVRDLANKHGLFVIDDDIIKHMVRIRVKNSELDENRIESDVEQKVKKHVTDVTEKDQEHANQEEETSPQPSTSTNTSKPVPVRKFKPNYRQELSGLIEAFKVIQQLTSKENMDGASAKE